MESANLILTYSCRNACPYCFASETREGLSRESMRETEFDECLDLLKRSDCREVRLMGGDPLLHPQIKPFLRKVLVDEEFQAVSVFSTGFIDEDLDEILVDRALILVININEPGDYPPGGFGRIQTDCLRVANKGTRISLGFNIYKLDFDYAPILALAEELGTRVFRWAIAAPSRDGRNKHLSREERRRLGPTLIRFMTDIKKRGIKPVMDCAVEPCMFSDEELGKLAKLCPSIVERMGRCSPVMDLVPGLKVLRCFSAPAITEKNIRDFRTLQEIREFFQNRMEAYRPWIAEGVCKTCEHLRSGACLGGCIANVSKSMAELSQTEEECRSVLDRCKGLYRQGMTLEVVRFLEEQVSRSRRPEIVLELGHALLKSGKHWEFDAWSERWGALLENTGFPSVNVLRAMHHEQQGDRCAAARYLRRSLKDAPEEKSREIRRMLDSLQIDRSE